MEKDKLKRLKKVVLFFTLLFFIPLITTQIIWMFLSDGKTTSYETLFLICELSFIVSYLCRPLYIKIFKPSNNLKKYTGLSSLYLIIIALLVFL